MLHLTVMTAMSVKQGCQQAEEGSTVNLTGGGLKHQATYGCYWRQALSRCAELRRTRDLVLLQGGGKTARWPPEYLMAALWRVE